MSTRLYSYYDDQEMSLITKAADELGLSITQFQKYTVLLYILKDESLRKNMLSMATLKRTMETSLEAMKPGTTFVASSLFDPSVWANLSRGEKREISSILKKRVDADPAFKVAGKIQRGTLNRYEKLSD